MSVIQVTHTGTSFAVSEDGVVVKSGFETRGQAIKAAMELKENS